ncbi:MAG: type II/IV secretion system protein [Burkholderiales bacterium]|nr:type II/IV secretion system protein [Burkholderiales bacterium]
MNARTELASGPAGAAAMLPLGQPGRRVTVEDLLPALVADGLLGQADAETVERYARLSSAEPHALVAIARRKLKSPGTHRTLDLEVLCPWFARRVGLPFMRIDPLKVDLARVAEVMSSQYATRFRILPLEIKPAEVTIATAEPFVTDWVDELGGLLRRDIRRVIANPQDIARYIVEFFTLARTVRGAQKNGAASSQGNFEQLVELGRSGRNLDANDQHVVTIVDWLWQYAFEQRASDIHLEPRRETGSIRFRIDGVLHNVYQLPASVLAAMTSRIKLLGRMDVVEKRRPQDGRIKTRTGDGREIELRLSTLPTAFGEKLVMRVFDPEVLVRDFAQLGFYDDDLETWEEMTSRPNGIVLVTGPTGSGKTTTLYTTLKMLATEDVNVCTVEDPIEMVEPSFNQMQVQHGIELSFADGIRALMRQDPDIIMVGEIRDLETAEMAVQAALTGHLVLSTLHTNDAASAITRLLDLGVAPYLLNATLIGVMAQRLVRTLCESCKEEAGTLTDEQWETLIKPFRAARPARVYRPVGCLECRMTGYRGRNGLYELLVLDAELRALINDKPDLGAIRRRAMRGGLRPLRLAGAQRIAAGQTTWDEVVKAAPPISG